MPDLLFELGCEELPASAVERAFNQLAQEIADRLTEAGVTCGARRALGTPRRLIVAIDDVLARQPDTTKDFRGPSIASAFDPDGRPTKALEGFCRGHGVDVSAVRQEGEYVWITKTIEGKPTKELLQTILPEAVRSLTFDKTMRWGSGRMRFARPIRWILAAFGGEPVGFDLEGVSSGLTSRGHRFYAPNSFEAKSFDELIAKLRERHVEPDPEVRRQRIIEGANAASSGTPELTEGLVDENVYLTEWPTAVEGEFKSDYLALPDSVLVTAMAKHERFFPVRDASGRLTSKFVSIRNAGVDEVVRQGNAWVLNARFNDAKFFFDEDKKRTLDDFLNQTSRMLFQEKLGTVRQRADRLAALAAAIAKDLGLSSEEVEHARLAGLYAKADLTTGLVSELASLQGLIGGEYARREGLPEAVCQAIATQYDSSKAKGIVSFVVIVADQLDKLAGYLGIGLEPSGSSDPYGLRRAATTLIEIALNHGVQRANGIRPWVQRAVEAYGELLSSGSEQEAGARLAKLFRSRYEALWSDEPYDAVNAALSASDSVLLDPKLVLYRLENMKKLKAEPAVVQAATRPLNILDAAVAKGHYAPSKEPAKDLAAMDSAEGEALSAQLEVTRKALDQAEVSYHSDAAVNAVIQLQKPIHDFFENTMVMTDDAAVRQARLSLVDLTCRLLERTGNFRELVIE